MLLALTGVRVPAALAILLFHFTPSGLAREVNFAGHGLRLSLYPMIDNGFVFVSFFFLLSGFILTYNYFDQRETLSLRTFWFARAARLYPVYLLLLAASWQMLRVEFRLRPRGEFLLGTVLSVLMLQAWVPRLSTFWTTVGWALSCEVAFYLLFPLLLRARWPRRAVPLLGVLFALWLVSMLPYAAYLLLNPDHLLTAQHGLAGASIHSVIADRYTGGHWLEWLKYTPLPYLCTFVAGMALARVRDALVLTPRAHAWLTVAGGVSVCAAFYWLVPHVPYLLVVGGLMMPAFAVSLLGLSGPSWFSSLLGWRPLLELGAVSYCLYLLHYNGIVLLHVDGVFARLHLLPFDPWVSYMATVLLALVVYRLVELPCHRALMRWWWRVPRP